MASNSTLARDLIYEDFICIRDPYGRHKSVQENYLVDRLKLEELGFLEAARALPDSLPPRMSIEASDEIFNRVLLKIDMPDLEVTSHYADALNDVV